MCDFKFCCVLWTSFSFPWRCATETGVSFISFLLGGALEAVGQELSRLACCRSELLGSKQLCNLLFQCYLYFSFPSHRCEPAIGGLKVCPEYAAFCCIEDFVAHLRQCVNIFQVISRQVVVVRREAIGVQVDFPHVNYLSVALPLCPKKPQGRRETLGSLIWRVDLCYRMERVLTATAGMT